MTRRAGTALSVNKSNYFGLTLLLGLFGMAIAGCRSGAYLPKQCEIKGNSRAYGWVVRSVDCKAKVLEWQGNWFTTIFGLEQLTSLEWLDLRYNNLTQVPTLCRQKNLKYLFLNNNTISKLSSDCPLPALQVLHAENSGVAEIDPAGFPALRELDIKDNLVKIRPDQTVFKKLKKLIDQNNQYNMPKNWAGPNIGPDNKW